MFDAFHLMKVALNVKYFFIKVAKYKQSSILTSIQNTEITITVLFAKKQQKPMMVQVTGHWETFLKLQLDTKNKKILRNKN
jgi:hypothetical protein